MKTLSGISFIILFILIPAIQAQGGFKRVYEGKVKSVAESYYQLRERSGRFDTVSEGKLIMKFDTLGKIYEQYRYTSSGKSFRKIIPLYNENGKTLEEREYVNDTFKARVVPEYDKRGKIIAQRIYGPDSLLNYSLIFFYNEKGQMEEQKYFNLKGKSYLKNTYRYDKDGNLVRHNSYRGDGSLIFSNFVKYENYDKTGNWLKSFVVGNEDRPGFFTIREIEYYK